MSKNNENKDFYLKMATLNYLFLLLYILAVIIFTSISTVLFVIISISYLTFSLRDFILK